MPDLDELREATDFSGEAATSDTNVKGATAQDWGLQHRLSRVFDPLDGKTVMLAFDHGYFQGPTSGLERLDVSIRPLVPHADAIMLTRGALRTSIPPATRGGVVLRASGGPSILKELSDEHLAMDIEDAARLGADALAIQVFIGGDNESRSVKNLNVLVDHGQRYGIPVLGVTAVGKELVRDARYFRLATRIIAEMGAHMVKAYYVEDGFDTVTASCPVPIIVAGGKKIAELDALTMAYRAIEEGAAGVDMGRNVWQSEHPLAMMAALREVVHNNAKPAQAHELFLDLAADARR